ncbi:GNAT family N-acetyltransferase [Sporolactobacillus kofuensis]|uniref:GNAT family N-acetyltransferase n=1 Tax=Sporolactobacillus kofuensis TaxID=269672 RepID=A0ABW1WF69_9BACL|nr:GNAT family N-acetyltransferase [Sporolactobacillus kofuensis]MCO7175495.1 GNAT family N-acetyltransferase [Sporolactobacillus kofuensis]
MITDQLIAFENNFGEVQSEVIEKPYGRIFHDTENPLSYDSNHAYIEENAEFGPAVQDVVTVFRSLGLPPRIYTFSMQESKVGRYLANNGFRHRVEGQSFFVQTTAKIIDTPVTLHFSRIATIDASIDTLFASDPDQGEWAYKSLFKPVTHPNFYLFGGYASGELVCLASLYRRGDISRINDVFTKKNKRGQGYASQLINFLTDFNRKNLETTSYLYSNVPPAIHIYNKAGYEKIDSMIRGYYWLD